MREYSKPFIDLCAVNAHQKTFHNYEGKFRDFSVSEHDKRQIRADVRRVLAGCSPRHIYQQWRDRAVVASGGSCCPEFWSEACAQDRQGFELFHGWIDSWAWAYQNGHNVTFEFTTWPGEDSTLQSMLSNNKKHASLVQKSRDKIKGNKDAVERLRTEIQEKKQREQAVRDKRADQLESLLKHASTVYVILDFVVLTTT